MCFNQLRTEARKPQDARQAKVPRYRRVSSLHGQSDLNKHDNRGKPNWPKDGRHSENREYDQLLLETCSLLGSPVRRQPIGTQHGQHKSPKGRNERRPGNIGKHYSKVFFMQFGSTKEHCPDEVPYE